MKKCVFILVLAGLALQARAQIRYKTVDIPDIPGYKTLKCDFHIHTIYSDGNVTPDVRILEAVAEGLDAIAFTDHVYGSPRNNNANEADRNSAFKKAKDYAELLNVLIINGAEISRGMPPGHVNAVFVSDANALITPEFMDSYTEAKRQGGLLLWNHPGWWRHQAHSTNWFDVHNEIFSKGLMQGIEVVNASNYYPEAHQWCLEKNLTMIANSDSHLPTNLVYDFQHGQHRPMTLVFAKDRSVAAVRDAMMERRTVVYHGDELIGREEYLRPLFAQSIEIAGTIDEQNEVEILVRNKSDVPFRLKKKGINPDLEYDREFTIPAKSYYIVGVRIKKEGTPVKLDFEVQNLLIKPNEGMDYQLLLPDKKK
jgi:predicted metal-dependent phosphoesterase TrpH